LHKKASKILLPEPLSIDRQRFDPLEGCAARVNSRIERNRFSLPKVRHEQHEVISTVSFYTMHAPFSSTRMEASWRCQVLALPSISSSLTE